MIDEKRSFSFSGRGFVPHRNFTRTEAKDFPSIMSRLRSVALFDRGVWDYNEFYAASHDSVDIYLCEDDGRLYVPGQNELFEWVGRA